MSNPFLTPPLLPGHGTVTLTLLPPSLPTLSTLSYRYPLKLLTRTPAVSLQSVYPETASTPVHLYLLTYGGGLLPGDHIDVDVRLCRGTRMVVATPQGSQKIYKTERRDDSKQKGAQPYEHGGKQRSSQCISVYLGPQAALCYLPDPTVPYKDSQYEQTQRFYVHQAEKLEDESSLCMLDWVTQGRGARGEDWSFRCWKGKNEIISLSGGPPDDVGNVQGWEKKRRRRRLLLRDNVILEAGNTSDDNDIRMNEDDLSGPLSISSRVHPHGVIGTLILYGPIFSSLSRFFMEEFMRQPRIRGRNWSAKPSQPISLTDEMRKKSAENVTWTAARIREKFVLVKFGAKNYEAARNWLGEMVRREGSIGREFGEEGYGCL
ncbi:hypothetical protein KEM54_000332 [Ascosphaera aggregata]|nr:hypothetical protein KEM54_000332 [Ascosphaera aggregata]